MWTPHPVIVTIGDNRDYIRVLLYSYYIYHYYRVGGPPKGFHVCLGEDKFVVPASSLRTPSTRQRAARCTSSQTPWPGLRVSGASQRGPPCKHKVAWRNKDYVGVKWRFQKQGSSPYKASNIGIYIWAPIHSPHRKIT